MVNIGRFTLYIVALIVVCTPPEIAASERDDDAMTVTLLFTNDIESAYDPVPAFWIGDLDHIGGIAQMATLIEQIRSREPNVFLFDSGDIFTGALSRQTEGALMFEFMITMGYDAMAIGNHEFDYGHEVLTWQKNRAPFPVLGANLFYKNTDHPYSQAHTIIERDGVRIGVIGILGQDAASSAIAPAHIAALDVLDPAESVRQSIRALDGAVDLIVLLTHQGHTAPMQTDAEIDPRLQRDIDKDIALAGAVDGIDVLFGGHADAGTPEPVVNPDSGTLIMQTYGQATYLGYLQLTLNRKTKVIESYTGKLIPVDSDALTPHPIIEEKFNHYRAQYPELTEIVGSTDARLNRKYFDESDLGNLIADVLAEQTGSDIGMMHPGGIRKDFPKGDITIADILDTNPFVDLSQVVEVNGAVLRKILEQSLTLDRGLMQISGIEITFDLSKPERDRLVSLNRNGKSIKDGEKFTVAAAGIIARGGDHYDEFLEGRILRDAQPVSDLLIAYFKKHGRVPLPQAGRQVEISNAD